MRLVDHIQLLEMFELAAEGLGRATVRAFLAGYERHGARRNVDRLVERLRRQGLVERTDSRKRARYRITDEGRRRAVAANPRGLWAESWDGVWRVVTFDLPEVRRKDRKRLWRALRSRNLGFLQRSVWIWPRSLEPILQEIIESEGVPECFCGFETRRLFLCTDAEVVASAWRWEEIERRQHGYLNHPTATLKLVQHVETWGELAMVSRSERQAYVFAMELDPLLPQALLPPGYPGQEVQRRHEEFRCQVARRFNSLMSG